MEKPVKSKNRLLKFLPKAASSVGFQNLPFSPRSDQANRHKTQMAKGFSGPMISIIPADARRKSKNSNFEAQEPTSPKVSCMGQIKHKKNKKITKPTHDSMREQSKPHSSPPEVKKNNKPSKKIKGEDEKKIKKQSTIKNMFGKGSKPAGRKSDASADHSTTKVLHHDRAPSLSQMKRFSSTGRDTFANFDWMAQIQPVEDSDPRNCYSDEEERGESNGEDDGPIIPFSAPMMVGGRVGLEPKKEINLWKRRTLPQPKPLQLK